MLQLYFYEVNLSHQDDGLKFDEQGGGTSSYNYIMALKLEKKRS